VSKRYLSVFVLCYLVFIIVQACDNLHPEAIDEGELLDGPIEGLSYAENQQFLKGDIAFNDEIFTVEKGLGPTFVATSCGSCHAGDGKGTPFSTLTRFGQVDETGNLFLHLGGPQLQNRAIPGFTPRQFLSERHFPNLLRLQIQDWVLLNWYPIQISWQWLILLMQIMMGFQEFQIT
jgi:hypothetical protein